MPISMVALASLTFVPRAAADTADVLKAVAVQEANGAWRFTVTVSHPDDGWEHFADRWEVIGPDGEILGIRTLLHPHVEEQPFVRSLGGIDVPAGVSEVRIRANCSTDGLGGAEVTIRLEE
ncbi:MAG: hypothetical protein R3245_02330 [Kiloniellales bacterium]|nr:hypothetical protein [Kiloniellales bacterium]